MREIDPIRNPSEALLSAALNRLAKGSPRQAPPNLGAQLAQEFRRHHVRRRRKIAAVSIVACLGLATTVFLTLRLSMENAAPPVVDKQPVPAVAPDANPPAPDTFAKSTPLRKSGAGRRSAQASSSNVDQDGFMTVGVFDPSMAAGDLKVVRLELTGADLRLVGAPVAEDLSDRRLLADIVVASDGTPYAVRLVR